MKKISFLFFTLLCKLILCYGQCPPIATYSTLGSTLPLSYFWGSTGPAQLPCLLNPVVGEQQLVKFSPPAPAFYDVKLTNYTMCTYCPAPPSYVHLYSRAATGTCDLTGYSCGDFFYDNGNGGEVKYTFNMTGAGLTYDILLAADSAGTYGNAEIEVKCSPPRNLYKSNVTSSSALINFTSANVTYFEYGPSGFTPGTGSTAGGGTLISNATSPVSLTSLMPFTNYDVYIRSKCGAIFTDNVALTFRTPHGCGNEPFMQCGTDYDINTGYQYSGDWQNYNCGITGMDSQEYLYRFTPSQSGTYSIQSTLNYGYYAAQLNVYYKTVGGSCDPNGWTCIGNFTAAPQTLSWGPLTAGTTYLLLFDGYHTSLGIKRVRVDCLSPCTATIVAGGNNSLCNGSSVTLNANTGTGITYQWYRYVAYYTQAITGATASSYTTSTPGIYYVVETIPSCGSITSNNITVSSNSTTSTITPSGPTTICSGSVVLNANTGTGLTYQWKNNGTNITGATGSSFTATTSGSYTVVVTATGGCSATSTTTVVTIGALTASVTPGGTVTVCSGTSTTLSATGGTGYSYQWYRNNVVLSTATAATFTTSTAGTYKCVVTSGSCTTTTNSVVVSVTNNPTPAVSYSTPLSFCSPGSVLLSGNSYAGVSYQWENNSVAIGGATAQSYTATTAGQYRVKQTANGCVKYSGKVTVSTATTPTATITASGSTTLCTAGTVAMSVSSPVPGYTYQWKKNNVNIAGATGTSYGATSTGNYTVAATASCGTGISNAIAVNIGSFTAQVIPSGTATLCTGSSLMLSANTGTGFTYQWKNNNVNISGATGSTYSVTTAGSYTVFMTSPCGNATSAATVVTQSTVTASVTPAGSSTVCSGSSITLTANAGTGYTYRWYRNNVLLAPTTQTFTTSTAGSYKVEVSISGSCATQSNTAVITVINNATPTVTAGGPTTFCAGQSVTFTANTYAGVTQQWQKNSVNIAGATNQTYTATTGGNYRVQQTANGCTKNSAQNAVTVNCRLGQNGEELSSDETGTATQMNVYPNPFEDKLNINITSPTTEQTEVKVIDVLGKVKYSQTITTNTETEVNMQLPAGIYMLTTIVEGKMKTQRVVKVK